MITNISHNLDLSVINENDFSNIQILDDRDNVHFCYQNVPFRFSVGQINASDRAEVIYCILDKRVDNEEDIDFYWSEITYSLTEKNFINLAFLFPHFWEFHSEIIESDDKSITFYAYMQDDEKVYSLQAPEQESQKASLNFKTNVFSLFEDLENVRMRFTANCQYTWVSVMSRNIFLADQQKDVSKWLKLIQLTPTTEENYELFFDIDFTCYVENSIVTFKIGNFTFEYEY